MNIMLENQIYHIYNRGNNRERIFLEEKNYQFFLQRFRYYLNGIIDVYAYCLMPNHFHFLVKINKINEGSDEIVNSERKLTLIEKSFKDFFISYSKAINKAYNRTGSLFQTKFRRKPITDESYLNNIVAYIHLNPVRAGFVKNAEDWKHSSYKGLKENFSDILNININEVLGWFRGKENFIEFHNIYRDFQNERDYLFEK